jgi:hypothetical protein
VAQPKTNALPAEGRLATTKRRGTRATQDKKNRSKSGNARIRRRALINPAAHSVRVGASIRAREVIRSSHRDSTGTVRETASCIEGEFNKTGVAAKHQPRRRGYGKVARPI